MSDSGGLAGALLLSDQISTDRLFDSYRRARETSKLVLNDAAWRGIHDELVNSYNRLLADAKRLADVQDQHIAGLQADIAELAQANAALEAEKRGLNEELAKVRFQLAVERQWHQERRPNEFS